jgi:putative ABC transport system permease protein
VALVTGRLLTRDDLGENTPAIVVNETLAELCWPGRSALGQKLRAQERQGEPQYEVVGVVRDTRTSQLTEPVRPIFYRPFAEAQLTGARDQLFVRTEQDPVPLVAAMRHEVHALNPAMRQPSITISQRVLFDATAAQRTYRNYLTTFAGVGLLLAAIGIYGVLAQAVARRTREIGIRMALGADRRAVVALVLGEGARLIARAYWLTQLLQKQLFGVQPHDLGVQAAVVAVLAATGLIACWLPARRAAKVDPIVALRAE